MALRSFGLDVGCFHQLAVALELAAVQFRELLQRESAGLAGEASTLTLEQFAELNRSEFERYGKLVKAANIKAE